MTRRIFEEKNVGHRIGIRIVCSHARIIILTGDCDDGGYVCDDENQQREYEHEDQAQSRVELFLPSLGVEAVNIFCTIVNDRIAADQLFRATDSVGNTRSG